MIFQHFFGHREFKPGQRELIEAMLAGNDVLGILPARSGKSVCYQMAALLLPGLTVAVSPAPEKVRTRPAHLTRAGIPTCALHDGLTPGERAEVFGQLRDNRCKLLFVLPDQLLTSDFLALIHSVPLSLLAVDEAQYLSRKRTGFRPDYLSIPDFLRTFPQNARPVVAAFTSDPDEDVGNEIQTLLSLRKPLRMTAGFRRPNLCLDVASPRDRCQFLLRFLTEHTGQTGLIYCNSPHHAERLSQFLAGNGISALPLHPELPDRTRQDRLEQFRRGSARLLIVSGITDPGDLNVRPDIRFILHCSIPDGLDTYYNEISPAGRDGKPAQCMLLFSSRDVQSLKAEIEADQAPGGFVTQTEREEFRRAALSRLDRMAAYCKSTDCFAHFLLLSFGEQEAKPCGVCGNCTSKFIQQDITVEARQIIGALTRVQEHYMFGLGRALIVHLLHGNRDRRVVQMGLDRLPDFGVLSHLSCSQIRAYLDSLIREQLLYLTGGEFPVLKKTEYADEMIADGRRIIYKVRVKRRSPAARKQTVRPEDEGLLTALKKLRTDLARESGAPAYVIFSNATLEEMAAQKPRDREQLLTVTGVGEVKAARYGPRFLDCIRTWKSQTAPPAPSVPSVPSVPSP